MPSPALSHAHYWRNALADTALGRGSWSRTHIQNALALSKDDVLAGKVSDDTVLALFSGEPHDQNCVNAVLYPYVYCLDNTLEHGERHQHSLPPYITPVLAYVCISRAGYIYPFRNKTFIARDLLEPNDNAPVTLGFIQDVDEWLKSHEIEGIAYEQEMGTEEKHRTAWCKYLASCKLLREAVQQCQAHGYRWAECARLLKQSDMSGSRKHILKLYERIQADRPDVPLFETYARDHTQPPVPCLPATSHFSQRLAHANASYSLSTAQRDTLTHLLAGRTGDILGVNGPPGTGKTTLLLSVVATLWARAALEEEMPPIILAASANNQAVTNIIDAFGQGVGDDESHLAGRWLPALKSYGAYHVSNSREQQSVENYHTQSFFQDIECEAYVEKAERFFMEKARDALPHQRFSSVEDVVKLLHRELAAQCEKLQHLERCWQEMERHRHAVQATLGNNPEDTHRAHKRDEQDALHALQQANTCLAAYDESIASMPWWCDLLGWWPVVARKRLARLRRALYTKVPDGLLDQVASCKEVHDVLQAYRYDKRQQVQRCQLDSRASKALLDEKRRLQWRWQQLLSGIGFVSPPNEASLEAVDAHVDTAVRFYIFQLTTHYWEGRWLLHMRSLSPRIDEWQNRQGKHPCEQRLQWRMMLTPCLVSTFFMLPTALQFCPPPREDGRFSARFLYNLADLLIVDEAGQVSPEVAGASFALAKQALVIGDTQQIAPIWSIPASVDFGNALQSGVWNGRQDGRQPLSDSGKMPSSGSVMRIAQQASQWHYQPKLERGMLLNEHRRCFDDIVEYCNRLCYQGCLTPLRGRKPLEAHVRKSDHIDDLPPLGYLHIEGICESVGGSRGNVHEAEVVATWLAEHRAQLESRYEQPLNEIVAIVTPFGAQVSLLIKACEAQGISAGREKGMLTTGTVHALQGAERPIVIFSSVYSKHPDGNGQFIDHSPSMLNVAVSRAKNSFLVFGDMSTFERAPATSPRGKLADMLLERADNQLTFRAVERKDLSKMQAPWHLIDAEAHDAFLFETLVQAVHDVMIVSPWITLRVLRERHVLSALSAAVARGVAVTVYTDEEKIKQACLDDRAGTRVWQQITSCLIDIGVNLIALHRVHSKLVLADSNLYCVGSFNWLSANRTDYKNHETSFVYRGDGLKEEILAQKYSLKQRRVIPV